MFNGRFLSFYNLGWMIHLLNCFLLGSPCKRQVPIDRGLDDGKPFYYKKNAGS